MHCPFCGANDTKVIDSRLVAEGEQVRRRRECLACEERFTTFETAELVMPRLIKSDGSRQPFDEEKLRAGMQRALEKRPVSVERLELRGRVSQAGILTLRLPARPIQPASNQALGALQLVPAP